MWTILTLLFCAVYPALTIVLQQETGPIHIHKKPNSVYWSGFREETPLKPQDVVATKIAEDFIKNFLPTLDTRIKKSAENQIFLDELNAGFTLALNDFIWVGFRHATLDYLAVRMLSKVKFNASIPYLSAGGTVSVNGNIEDINIAIIGNLSTLLEDVKVTGIIEIDIQPQLPSDRLVLKITDADIKIDLSNIGIEFELVEEPVALKMALAKLMNKPVDKIVESVYRAAMNLINEQLAKILAMDIINILEPEIEKPATVPSVQRRSPYLRASNYPNYRYGYN